MGKYLNTDTYVSINGTDLSDHAFNVDMKLERDQVDVTGFSSAGTKEYLPGNKDEEVTVSFLQDFAAAKVDATLSPLYFGGTPFPIVVRPTSGTASTTNPVYSGSAYLFEYHPIDGAVGARSETNATFKFTGAVARGTA